MDFLNTTTFLSNTVLIGGENNNPAPEAAAAEVSVPAPGAEGVPADTTNTGGFMGSNYFMIAYILGLIVLFYFFAIRPQKKREKEQKEMLGSIQIGDPVMTSGGFFGKVVDLSDEVFVVEFGTNKGVRIPVRKSEVLAKKGPNMSSEAE